MPETSGASNGSMSAPADCSSRDAVREVEEKLVGEPGDPRASRIGAEEEEGFVEADGFGRGAEPPLGGSGQEFFELPGVALAEVGFPGVQAVQQVDQDHSITAPMISD